VVIRRARFELRKAEERAETLEGYLIALANLDEFIRIIRQSNNREEAKIKLLAFDFTRQQVEHIGVVIRSEARLTSGRYSFSDAQANAILELRLYQLTGMEAGKVRAEYTQLLERIKDLMDILAREARVFAIIKAELKEIKEKYATPRLTELIPDEGEIAIGGPDRQRRRHHHHHPRRPDQAHERQLLPRPAPRRKRRHRHDHP